MKQALLSSLAFCLCLAAPALIQAADNAVGDKPYMGWSSWSCFSKGFNEARIAAQADVMASRLKKFGYAYINIDAGWHNDNDYDAHGRRLPDAAKFPHGINWLADYVHNKGLKFGLYIEPGMPEEAYKQNGIILGTDKHITDITDATQQANTLEKNFFRIDYGKAGAAEWTQSSADLLASFGIDFIKIDFVGPSNRRKNDTREDVKQWSLAFQKTGRPVWIELSNNLTLANADVWKKYSNGWRIEGDVEDHKNRTLTSWPKILQRFHDLPAWASVAGKGGWNDLDSLEIGTGDKTGLTPDERRTAMTLWCISCAPLYLGSDLTQMTDEDFAIVTNEEAIAIDQAGVIATPISQKTPQQVWRANNLDGSYTVALFNLADTPAKTAVKWSDLGINGGASVRDLWSHTDLGAKEGEFVADLAPHACRLLKVTPAR